MVDELIDICDNDNNLTGVQKMKTEAHKKGLWHRASHIWVYNSKKEILLHLRSKDKSFFPNVWDLSAGGHIGANEDPINGGLREIQEEIGLKLTTEDLLFMMIKKQKTKFEDLKNNEFYYVYLYKFDGNADELKLQTEEVQEARFFPINTLEKDLKINPNKYVSHGDYWFEVIDKIRSLEI